MHGVILQEGRAAAGGRAELFAPGAVVWPSDGVAILPEHHGTVETRAVPTREANGESRIAATATPALFAAVQARAPLDYSQTSAELRDRPEVRVWL